jgi:hypothetical protein
MDVTEQEAKSMRCPLLSIGASLDSCIASRCMMWNWIDEEKHNKYSVPHLSRRIVGVYSEEEANLAKRPDDVPASWTAEADGEGGFCWYEPADDHEARRAEAAAEWPQKRRGCCGLARSIQVIAP